jgi:hypothetical protein
MHLRLRPRFQTKHTNLLSNTTYTNKIRLYTRSPNTRRPTKAVSSLPPILRLLARMPSTIHTRRLASSPWMLLSMAPKWDIVSTPSHPLYPRSNMDRQFREERCRKAKDLRSTTCLNIVTNPNSPNNNTLNNLVAPCPCHPIRLHRSRVRSTLHICQPTLHIRAQTPLLKHRLRPVFSQMSRQESPTPTLAHLGDRLGSQSNLGSLCGSETFLETSPWKNSRNSSL